MKYEVAFYKSKHRLFNRLVCYWLRGQIGDQRKWFCSEAVAAMLGFPEPWRFDPMTLWAAVQNGGRK